MAIALTDPVVTIPGVGPSRARALQRIGIRAIGHLIDHLPARYEHEEAESTIAECAANVNITTRGQIVTTRIAGGRTKRFEAVLADESGTMELVWFNQTFLRDRIGAGMWVRIQGRGKPHGPRIRVANPWWEPIAPEDLDAPRAGARLRPVYPATEGVTSRAIESAVERILEPALALIEDHLPENLREKRDLPALAEAYRMLHKPSSMEEAERARRRLAYDELLLLQLGVFLRRTQSRTGVHAMPIEWSERIDQRIRARLPFTLTEAQDEVVREIVDDVQRDVPMNRLLQGDVGAGKTAVAVYAMLLAVAAGHQAALMAPTELLARQHFASLGGYLRRSRVRLERIAGTHGASDRVALEEALREGDIDIAVGTHALLSESVAFRSLGLAVIDEQHRFGVHQRAGLRTKVTQDGTVPHTLVMTATPIPRTLALTVFGDLDVSSIRALPPGRSPIETTLLAKDERDKAYRAVRARVEKGEQAYVVVPTVSGDEQGALESVDSMIAYLRAGPLAGLRVEGVHARMTQDEQQRIMAAFRDGELGVLVATTIIEVGVDVPNATAMVIEDAGRFGLAQLHQLRGRVGRGAVRGACYAVSENGGGESAARLRAFASTTDGFELAERDLELRGAGEFSGAQQSGLATFQRASFPRDTRLLTAARDDARDWIAASPALDGPDERVIRKRLLRVHGETLGLLDVG